MLAERVGPLEMHDERRSGLAEPGVTRSEDRTGADVNLDRGGSIDGDPRLESGTEPVANEEIRIRIPIGYAARASRENVFS